MQVVFVGRDRPVWKRILLYLLTFGISRRIWLYRLNKELDGHEALAINHHLNAFLLWLPILGPTIVTKQTASRMRTMLRRTDCQIKYGYGWLNWVASWIPILGNMWFIGWTQSRANRFWRYERKHPEHGIELDLDLSNDPKFLIELEEARKQSRMAGTQYDRRRQRREERRLQRETSWNQVKAQRAAVRAAGGSTPVLPWRAPRPPAHRILHITCGRCQTAFDLEQDPLVETTIICPQCALTEVLPGAGGDPLAGTERVQVAVVAVDCPKCATHFTTARKLHGPTQLSCPSCGLTDELAAS